jgi:hypothetical protein
MGGYHRRDEGEGLRARVVRTFGKQAVLVEVMAGTGDSAAVLPLRRRHDTSDPRLPVLNARRK